MYLKNAEAMTLTEATPQSQSQNKTEELLFLLDNTDTIFTGHSDIPLERILLHIISSALKRDFDTAVWVCLKDDSQQVSRKLEAHSIPQDKTWILDAASGYPKTEYSKPNILSCATRDYTDIMLNLQKLMSTTSKPLVIIDSMGYLAIVENISTISRFWSYLSQQVKKKNGTLLTYLHRGAVERSIENAVLDITGQVFRVDENEIKYETDSSRGSIPYMFTKQDILLGEVAVNLEEKTVRELEKLFNLTQDEKYELESEIEEIHREMIEG